MATTHAAALAGDLAVELERRLQSLLTSSRSIGSPTKTISTNTPVLPLNPANHSGQSA
jgi:hypothetical protein